MSAQTKRNKPRCNYTLHQTEIDMLLRLSHIKQMSCSTVIGKLVEREYNLFLDAQK